MKAMRIKEEFVVDFIVSVPEHTKEFPARFNEHYVTAGRLLRKMGCTHLREPERSYSISDDEIHWRIYGCVIDELKGLYKPDEG
jgi:hypothetical protein